MNSTPAVLVSCDNIAPSYITSAALTGISVPTLALPLLDVTPEDWARRRDLLGQDIAEEGKLAHEHAQRACGRLLGKMKVEPIDNVRAVPFDDTFRLLTRQIKGSIDNGEPTAGLDQPHTFMMKYLRHLCAKYGIATTKEESLNAVLGKYVKVLPAFVCEHRKNQYLFSGLHEKLKF